MHVMGIVHPISQPSLFMRAFLSIIVLFSVALNVSLYRHYSIAPISRLVIAEEARYETDLNGFPVTPFTPHVLEVVGSYQFEGMNTCDNLFTISTSNQGQPVVSCNLNPSGTGVNPVGMWWCQVLQEQVFPVETGRRIPHNVSFAVSTEDMLLPGDIRSCVGSSGPEGKFSMINFHEIDRLKDRIEYKGRPWEQRHKTPIWRGRPWGELDKTNFSVSSEALYEQVMATAPRLKAVDFSLRHESLLDARIHSWSNEMTDIDEWKSWEKGTTRLHKLVQTDTIHPEEYFGDYQVSVVLCGIGAAFRTSILFGTGTAVMLQECDSKEWFSSLLVPFVHYIPLQKDFSDLKEQLEWIQEHPQQVKNIAERGRAFHDKFLSFESNVEHIYEFVYRLSLARREYEEHLTPKQLKDLEAKSHPKIAPVEVLSIDNGGEGNIEELSNMCRELLSRVEDSEEGNEPWRHSEGLTWKMNDCQGQAGSVLGNHLSRWYMIRAVAAKAGVTVQMSCESSVTDRIETTIPPENTVFDRVNGDTFSWRNFCRSCEVDDGRCLYPHAIETGGLETMRSVVVNDLRALSMNVLSEKPGLLDEIDDVSIHLRCGDIGRQDHALYGLVPFRSYESLIPQGATSIGIVTAPFAQDREGWGPGDPELNEAVVTATRNYLRKAFPKATVTIRNSHDDTLDVVYTRLIQANTTICGPSTFCVFPAIASVKQSYIMESELFGGEASWLAKVSESDPSVHYVKRKYYPSIDLFELSTADIVKKLSDDNEDNSSK